MGLCARCHTSESVQRAGFLRGRQRFFCKKCEYHFIDSSKPLTEPEFRQTTLADVAKALGIAASTVSRALNGHTEINANTRQAIVEMARQLNYQPNLLAQGLQSRETYTIGVIVPDLERPFFATAVSGIQEVAAAAGYRVMICQSKEAYDAEVSNVQALLASRVDGLIICHSRDTVDFAHVQTPASRGLPIVHFDRVCSEVSSTQVVLDNAGGAYTVTEHLIQEGCERIAILAGPEALLISQQRISGYQQALRRYQLPVRPEYEAHGDLQTPSVLASLATWLALPEPPDAIFAISYRNAFDIMLELKRRGLRVPQDVAVAGFGDEFLAALVEPGLTTIDLHPHRLGQQATSLLLDQMRRRATFKPVTFVMTGDLVIRQSSLKGQGVRFRLEL